METLQNLRPNLRDRGSDLVTRRGKAEKEPFILMESAPPKKMSIRGNRLKQERFNYYRMSTIWINKERDWIRKQKEK